MRSGIIGLFLIVYSANAVASGGSQGVETRSATPSVHQGAEQVKKENEKGSDKSNMTGALMFAMAAERTAACMAMDFAACAMAALLAKLGSDSMKQAKAHDQAARQAGLTSNQSDGFMDSSLGNGNDGSSDIPITSPKHPLAKDPNVAALKKNLDTLKPIFNSKTGQITLPDGKTFNASDSMNSMIDGGIPKGAVLGAMEFYGKAAKKVEEKYDKMNVARTKANGFEEGRGTASEISAGSFAEEPIAAKVVERNPLERDPSQLAGLQKNFNGEPIGIAEDNIFQMMTRRYKLKEKQDSFFSSRDF
ncbi:hypothetical protein [Bdellovibrio bacteriovorus]|uniref:hypothetical protein n=1 Tax=Bdellovibrio bacteriovorus TaxID=959 RepID=UPI0035A5B568